MPNFVHWLAAEPVRWLVPLTSLSCVVGIPLMLWREKRKARRRRKDVLSARQRQVLSPRLGLSADEQAAHDREALDAYNQATEHAAEAAERIVREMAAHLAHLYD